MKPHSSFESTDNWFSLKEGKRKPLVKKVMVEVQKKSFCLKWKTQKQTWSLKHTELSHLQWINAPFKKLKNNWHFWEYTNSLGKQNICHYKFKHVFKSNNNNLTQILCFT